MLGEKWAQLFALVEGGFKNLVCASDVSNEKLRLNFYEHSHFKRIVQQVGNFLPVLKIPISLADYESSSTEVLKEIAKKYDQRILDYFGS